MPYTIMQIEDVMFVDQSRLVALEYIFYQKTNGSKYSKIKREKEVPVNNPLGIDEYLKGKDLNKMGAFAK